MYGDRPNHLPLVELETRWELPEDHHWFGGIAAEMSIDRCTHSLFGASKVAADVMVQEYGRYFEMPTVCFRGGCLTGPQHAGAQLHGFLAYLMRCTVTGDAVHDLRLQGQAGARQHPRRRRRPRFRAFFTPSPTSQPSTTWAAGASRTVSMREAIDALPSGSRARRCDYTDDAHAPRIGDHRWWISDLERPPSRLPRTGSRLYDIEDVLREIHDANVERWVAGPQDGSEDRGGSVRSR